MEYRSHFAFRRNARLALIPADTVPTPTLESVTPDTVSIVGNEALAVVGSGFMSYAGLGYVEQVLFGDTPAQCFQIVDDLGLMVNTPAMAAGTYPLIVKTSGGCAVLVSGVTFA